MAKVKANKANKPATMVPMKMAVSFFAPLFPKFTKPMRGIVIFLFAANHIGNTVTKMMPGIITANPDSQSTSMAIPRPNPRM